MSNLLKIAVITLIVCIAMMGIGHFFLQYSVVNKGLQTITAHYWAFALFRYLLYGLVVLYWPIFIKISGKRQHWTEETIAIFSKLRLKLIGLFIIIEVFFVYNLLSHLVIWL
ncbi:MAG: hypothetical protein K2Q14_04670 [Gammaproteobacteria bacterium]|nr:hypothetical protein [Gammaproteobacteria bacterium]MBY0544825.1 hypothetical protein [Gammaproteobacteria bacterium]